MVEREKTRVDTVERELPVCPECDRAFEEQDMIELHANPQIKITTDEFQIYASKKFLSYNDTYYTDAFEVTSYWTCLVCAYCVRDKYNVNVRARPESEAREAVEKPVLTDGGIVNEYRTEYYTQESTDVVVHCNKCESECDESHTELEIEPELAVNRRGLSGFGKCYINENAHSTHNPPWQDAISIQNHAVVHLCPDCVSIIRPKLSLSKRLSNWSRCAVKRLSFQ